MKTNLKPLCLFLAMFFYSQYLRAQVSEIKKRSNENKDKRSDVGSNLSSDYDHSSTGGSDFFTGIFIAMFDGIGDAQRNMLSRKKDEPWLVSLEGNIQLGYDFKGKTFLFLPSIRGTWGLLSTQFRYNLLWDNSGSFRTLDWQIIQLNLVAKPVANFWIGTGFSHELDPGSTFHENLIGLAFHINQRRINPHFEFRFSKDYETGATPRLEFHSRLDFLLSSTKVFDINWGAGFTYQEYYAQVMFYFIQTGINVLLR